MHGDFGLDTSSRDDTTTTIRDILAGVLLGALALALTVGVIVGTAVLALRVGKEDGSGGASAVPKVAEEPRSVTREIACLAKGASPSLHMRMRLSVDGAIRQGVVTRTTGKDTPDERLDVRAVSLESDRLRIAMKSSRYGYRFSVAAAGFSAQTPSELDARLEETDDPSLNPADPAFSCALADGLRTANLVGEDAKALFGRLPAPTTEHRLARTRIVDTGSVRIACSEVNENVYGCTVRMPAFVTEAAGGRVRYVHDLHASEAKFLAAALGDTTQKQAQEFVGTTFEERVTRPSAETTLPSWLMVRCAVGTCHVDLAVADSFFDTML
jgi:hypothetical protein